MNSPKIKYLHIWLQKGVKSQGQSSTEIDEVITAMKGTFNNAVQCKY